MEARFGCRQTSICSRRPPQREGNGAQFCPDRVFERLSVGGDVGRSDPSASQRLGLNPEGPLEVALSGWKRERCHLDRLASNQTTAAMGREEEQLSHGTDDTVDAEDTTMFPKAEWPLISPAYGPLR
jgi:hypothetical protein